MDGLEYPKNGKRDVFILATRPQPPNTATCRPPAGQHPYFRTEIFIAAPEAAIT